jgi:16S rRNA (uracil1498-N3)-methyltransferase
MRLTRVYSASKIGSQPQLALSGQAGLHLSRVLRLKQGNELTLFDGSGGEYRGRIEAVAADKVIVQVLDFDPVERESPLQVTLLQGISRGERMDWTIQKATELGVTRIIPVSSARSMVKLRGERARRRHEHWQGVAISACEQCGRNRVPEISSACSLEQACELVSQLPLKIALATHADADAGCLPADCTALCLAVGPEGGLDPSEQAALEQHGFKPLRLGPRIMRTETAGVAALSVLQARWGDL